MTTKHPVTMTPQQLSCNACCRGTKNSSACVTCLKQRSVTCYRQHSDTPTDVVIGDLDVVRKLGVRGIVKRPSSDVRSSGEKVGKRTGNGSKTGKVEKSGRGKKSGGGGVETLDSNFNGIQREVERSMLLCDKVLDKLGEFPGTIFTTLCGYVTVRRQLYQLSFPPHSLLFSATFSSFVRSFRSTCLVLITCFDDVRIRIKKTNSCSL